MTNQQLKERYKQYLKSNYYSVNDFYKNCSGYKRKAESDIKYKMIKTKGTRLDSYKVIGGNSSHFTAGWLKEVDGNLIFVFETWQNTYILFVSIL